MKFEVDIQKKQFFVLLTALLLIAGIFAVYAYNTAFDAPNPTLKTKEQARTFGHSADELNIKLPNSATGSPITLQDAIDNGLLSGGSGFTHFVVFDYLTGKDSEGKSYSSASGKYTWVAPAGTSRVLVEVWGGGGAGRGVFEGAPGSGRGIGGGGGGYGKSILSVTGGSSYSIVVGGGGSAGNPANPGEKSSFDNDRLYADGGTGAGFFAPGPGVPGQGGTSNGMFSINGGTGGVNGYGDGGIGANGGQGGKYKFGTNGERGEYGKFPSGGGAGSTDGVPENGGGGAPGRIIIWW